MKIVRLLAVLSVLVLTLAGCASVPTVAESQAHAWQQFGNKPLQNLLLAWGPPMSDTHTADGTRTLSYSYSNMYDFGTRDQKSYSCKATITAPPPNFNVANIAMAGQNFECATIANGYSGQAGIKPSHPSAFFRDHPPMPPF